MDEREWLTERFEQHRPHLSAVAYRMLGSVSETDDALQEAWLRIRNQDPETVENMQAWLTTVVGRVCLNMLRSRRARREALVAESVGLALLVVLEALTPAERLAFVLHDVFGVPFADIATALDRSEAAAQQLASRARRRVRNSPEPDRDLARRRLRCPSGGARPRRRTADRWRRPARGRLARAARRRRRGRAHGHLLEPLPVRQTRARERRRRG